MRSERALKLAVAEMYVQGVSTRKVAAITEQLCGFEVSSVQVSRAAAELDAVLAAWRTRPLGVYRYVYLDARYEKVRQDGQVRDAAVLIASGVDAAGKRAVLGVSVALSEQEVHWRTFLQGLVEHGGEPPGRLDRVRVSGSALAHAADDERAGAAEPGDPTADAGGAVVSE